MRNLLKVYKENQERINSLEKLRASTLIDIESIKEEITKLEKSLEDIKKNSNYEDKKGSIQKLDNEIKKLKSNY